MEDGLNMPKKPQIKWRGNFNYSHELVIKYTYAPTWAAARVRMLRRIAEEHNVGFQCVFGMFDGTKDNFTIEREE